MPRRMQNLFTPQTAIGAGMQNLAAAMFSGPTRDESMDSQARRDYMGSQADQMRAATTKSGLVADQMRASASAREGLAGTLQQLQMLQQQGGDFGAEDTGFGEVQAGLPLAAAKYGVAGALDPSETAPWLQGAAGGDENMMRLFHAMSGKAPGATTAFTTGQAEDLNQQRQGNMIAQALAQAAGNQATAGARPMSVASPDSSTGYRYAPTSEVYGMEAPGPSSSPPVVGGKQMGDISDALYGALGDPEDDLSPALEQLLTSRASQIYQETGNMPGAIQQAQEELLGGVQLEQRDLPGLFTGDQIGVPQVSDGGVPSGAIQALMSNPALAPQFDAKYGPGASRSFLAR